MTRHIPLVGSKNFRDFGGYPTCWGCRVKEGVLFRSDSLSELTDEDIGRLSALNIRTVCDLRREPERERSPSRWQKDSDTTFYHLPFFSSQAPLSTGNILQDAMVKSNADASRQIMIDVYQNMVSDRHALGQIRRIFLLLAESATLPLLIHCSGGKDRTGVACALILTLLGVDESDVMEDYLCSRELYTNRLIHNRCSTSQVIDTQPIRELSEEILRPILSVESAYLNSVFESIRKNYIDLDDFFKTALELSCHQTEKIHELLTEQL